MIARLVFAAVACAIPCAGHAATVEAIPPPWSAHLGDPRPEVSFEATWAGKNTRDPGFFARWIATRYAEDLPEAQRIIVQMLADAAFGPVNGAHTGFLLVGPPDRNGPVVIHFSLFGTALPAVFAPVGAGLPAIAGRSSSVIEALPIDEPERFIDAMMADGPKPWAIPLDQDF